MFLGTALSTCTYLAQEVTTINHTFITHAVPFLFSYTAPPSRVLWEPHTPRSQGLSHSPSGFSSAYYNSQAFHQSSLGQVQLSCPVSSISPRGTYKPHLHQRYFRPYPWAKVTKQDTGVHKHPVRNLLGLLPVKK